MSDHAYRLLLMKRALARSDAEGIWIGLLSGVARLDARGLHRYDSDEGVAGALPGARG